MASVCIPDEALSYFLNSMLHDVAKPTTWYVGLVSATDFTHYGTDDTAARITTGTPTHPATHNGWAEIAAAVINEGARQNYTTADCVSAGVITNAVAGKAVFTGTGAGFTAKGAFVVTGSSTVGDTTGKIMGVGGFTGGDKVIAASDTLTVTISFTLASTGL